MSRQYSEAVARGVQHLTFTLVDTPSDQPEMEPFAYQATITNSKGFVLVFSYDDEESLEYVRERYKDIRRKSVSYDHVFAFLTKS